jgi:DNA-binding NarL/FixJ family response regulator
LDELGDSYCQGLSAERGRPAKEARLVIAAVIIKHKLCLSEVETFQQIQENPCCSRKLIVMSRLNPDRLFRTTLTKVTTREMEILPLALAGLSNKEIDRQLGISYRTVEIHRIRILQKTQTTNILELSRLYEALSFTPEAKI